MKIVEALKKVAGMQLSFGDRGMAWSGKRWMVFEIFKNRHRVLIKTKSQKKALSALWGNNENT